MLNKREQPVSYKISVSHFEISLDHENPLCQNYFLLFTYISILDAINMPISSSEVAQY